jgi:hypothetical protein
VCHWLLFFLCALAGSLCSTFTFGTGSDDPRKASTPPALLSGHEQDRAVGCMTAGTWGLAQLPQAHGSPAMCALLRRLHAPRMADAGGFDHSGIDHMDMIERMFDYHNPSRATVQLSLINHLPVRYSEARHQPPLTGVARHRHSAESSESQMGQTAH